MQWISNPFAFGAIGLYINRKPIGGISNTNNVKGYLCGDLVYEGDSEEDAMKEVEKRFLDLPEGVKRVLSGG